MLLVIKLKILLDIQSEIDVGRLHFAIDQFLLNEKTSVIHTKFLHKDPTNHHLNPSSLAKIISKELSFIISNL